MFGKLITEWEISPVRDANHILKMLQLDLIMKDSQNAAKTYCCRTLSQTSIVQSQDFLNLPMT